MPELTVPHLVQYDTPQPVPISDLIASLNGLQATAGEVGALLESCVNGLKVEKVSVSVRSISQESPLREWFIITLMVTYQSDLSKELPVLLEELFGVDIPDNYDTLVTVSSLVVIFYILDATYRKVIGADASVQMARMLDGLIKELANSTGCSEDKIREFLRDRYDKGRLRKLVNAAIGFFRPSKRQNNVSAKVGSRIISKEVMREIPGDVAEDVHEPETSSHQYSNVEIELHAQDRDRAKQGWAAVVPAISDARVKMQIFPPIQPEDVWTHQKIRGDIIAVFRDDGGDLTPTQYHLIRLGNDDA